MSPTRVTNAHWDLRFSHETLMELPHFIDRLLASVIVLNGKDLSKTILTVVYASTEEKLESDCDNLVSRCRPTSAARAARDPPERTPRSGRCSCKYIC
ncbi:hypothetical protein EVAR_6064_1 [Eumeta japonica]|uniref:Uncharacterized protein n=1 Tax=Eumeta variegata TaxID=151549 RepID=A0A4C1TCT0_EUMVA|nr:hypothetical protein EVAR_6064_1 [Eumeta japonica]